MGLRGLMLLRPPPIQRHRELPVYPEAGYMNRHFWRACDRGAGFSFVELLVTIIIAGIAFAALVPLFVSAQGKNSDDNMRVMTLQLARDKIEKVRQLDYDNITQANLDDEAFADQQFGNTYVLKSGTGSTRDLKIEYQVQNQPVGAADGEEDYKKVTVTVSWTGNPKPVYPAVLSTVVYKQYAGPQIIDFGIDPNVLEEVDPDVWKITQAPTTIDVYIASDDIGLMRPTGVSDPTKWGYVHFFVTSLSGNEVASDDVFDWVSPGHYEWTWDNSAIDTGIYILGAVAYSSGQQQGNSVSLAITVEVTVPPVPANFAGTTRDQAVQLNWSTTTITDFDHWELQTAVDPADAVAGPAEGEWTPLGGELTTNMYDDTGLTNLTNHWYRIRTVDTDGNQSAWATIGPLVPEENPDTTAPTVPGSFTVAKVAAKQNIQLAWAVSTDTGTGVQGYNVWRSPTGAPGSFTQILSYTMFNQILYVDTNVGWSTTYYYQVQAVDYAGNASGFTAALSATTDPQPKHSLRVSNNTGAAVTVWVQSATSPYHYFSQTGGETAGKPAGVTLNKNGTNASKTWTNLPEDTYNVFTSSLSKATTWTSDPWAVAFP
jgi:type II secretory pathway pseudopilin PulG